MPKTLLLIDGDILIFRSCAAATVVVEWEPGQFSNSSDAEQAKQRVDADIAEWTRTLKADSIIVCLSDHTANFRKELDPTYKANRVTAKPACYTAVEEYVRATYACHEMERLEADDVMGIWSTSPNKKKERRIIVSMDKDMLTIPGLLYNPMHPDRGVVEVEEGIADYNHLMQTLTGDRTDNYPGCPGIGPKKAARILESADGRDCDMWTVVCDAFKSAGLTEDDALRQARLARILRHGDFNPDGTINYWRPAA